MKSPPSPQDSSSIAPFVDRLYAASLESFTTTRKALVAELRAGGAAADAKRLGEMRKPSRSAWALGEVARHHAPELQGFLQATEGVREAQTRAVKERDPAAMRDAVRVFNARIKEIVTLAAHFLENVGASATTTQRTAIGRTLRALPFATSEEMDQVKRGTLATDLEPSSDFGVFGATPPIGTPAPELPSPPNRGPPQGGRTEEAARREERDAPVRREEREAARRAAEEARGREREAARLEKFADDADREAARLERAATDASRRAAEMEERAREARLEAKRARAAVESFRRELTAART